MMNLRFFGKNHKNLLTFTFSRVFFLGAGKSYDIMSLKEEQVAAKQTFVFLGSLANEYPAKQDVKCDSTNS